MPTEDELYAKHLLEFMRGGNAHVDLATVLDDFAEKLQGSRPENAPYHSLAAS